MRNFTDKEQKLYNEHLNNISSEYFLVTIGVHMRHEYLRYKYHMSYINAHPTYTFLVRILAKDSDNCLEKALDYCLKKSSEEEKYRVGNIVKWSNIEEIGT